MTVPDNVIRPLIADLIISDHEMAGSPVLPDESRGPLLHALEQLLVNGEILRAHIQRLQKVLGRRFRHVEPLPEDQEEAVLARGPDALDDATLARLLLNPIALHRLNDAISERMPDAWLPAMEEDGRQLQAAHGQAVPEFEPPALRRQALRRWRFDVDPAQCRWVGEPLAPDDRESALVRVTWQQPGYLRVRAKGFLRPRHGCRLWASWQSATGDVRAERCVIGPVDSVCLEIAGRQPPVPGDRLHLRHTDARGDRDVTLVLEL